MPLSKSTFCPAKTKIASQIQLILQMGDIISKQTDSGDAEKSGIMKIRKVIASADFLKEGWMLLVWFVTLHTINKRSVESLVYECGVSGNMISKRYVKAKKMDVRSYRDKRD